MMKQAQPRNTYEVTSQEAGTRIDKWFQHHFPTLAGAMVQRIIRKGQVRINGKRISSSTRLAVGDAIRVPPFSNAPKKITSTTAKKIASEIILVKTPDYLIINKPPQMASQGGENVKNHLDSILQALGEGANRPRLVHRLDKATSGIMVVAANAPVAAKLALQFKNRQVGKCYWALVCGVPKSRKGVITQNYNNEQEQTAYQVVASTAVASLIALVPKSGKKHQLRRHCVLLGTPIQGDTRYGQKPLRGIANKLHLHSVYLEFSEPQIYSQSVLIQPLLKQLPLIQLPLIQLPLIQPLLKQLLLIQPLLIQPLLKEWVISPRHLLTLRSPLAS